MAALEHFLSHNILFEGIFFALKAIVLDFWS